MADLTGDGRADIVGFGNVGAWVALNNGDGTFQAPRLATDLGGSNSGWQVDKHPRFLADLTGDGRAGIVGFGDDGVWVALNNGDGSFKAAQMVTDLGADGWHATEHALQGLTGRPLPADRWFAVSAHGREGLVGARERSADFAVLGPVLPTATHPGAPILQWSVFEALAAESGLPVFAIGGLGPRDVDASQQAGAQGVAGISAYWSAY